MFNRDYTQLKVYVVSMISFISYLISVLTLDIIAKIVAVLVGVTAAIYNIYKILGERAKRNFYKRIEKEQKRDEKKSL